MQFGAFNGVQFGAVNGVMTDRIPVTSEMITAAMDVVNGSGDVIDRKDFAAHIYRAMAAAAPGAEAERSKNLASWKQRFPRQYGSKSAQ